MGALHRFEQKLEHMVTGAFARAFRSAVQPMEIAAALQREVDNSAQILSRNRRIAPNDFTVDLSGTDFDRLSSYGQTLSSELAAMLHEHATEQHYVFAGPVHMHFQRTEDLTTGRFRVRSAAVAEVTPTPGQDSSAAPPVGRASVVLEIGDSRHPLLAPGLVVGRGSAADLRVDDPGVSRRHAEFRIQDGSSAPTVSVVDLGSTNGTTVDGRRVQHAVLHDGALVQIGATRILVRITGQSAGPGGAEPPFPASRPGQAGPTGPGLDPGPAPRPSTGWPPPYQPRTRPATDSAPSHTVSAPSSQRGGAEPQPWGG
jgi:hypothetical protein